MDRGARPEQRRHLSLQKQEALHTSYPSSTGDLGGERLPFFQFAHKEHRKKRPIVGFPTGEWPCTAAARVPGWDARTVDRRRRRSRAASARHAARTHREFSHKCRAGAYRGRSPQVTASNSTARRLQADCAVEATTSRAGGARLGSDETLRWRSTVYSGPGPPAATSCRQIAARERSRSSPKKQDRWSKRRPQLLE